MDVDRVERAAHAGQQMARRDHRRMHPRLDRAVVILGDREQLDREAKFARVGDIGRRDTADAFGMDLRRLEQHSEGERHQQAELVRGVMAFDIERGIGLGEAVALRLGERLGETRRPPRSSS